MWTLPAVALWLPSSTQIWSLTSDSPWSTQSAPVATSELPFPLACFSLAFLPLACFPFAFLLLACFPLAFCPSACFPLAVFPLALLLLACFLLAYFPLAVFQLAFLPLKCFPLAFFPFFQPSNLAAACSSEALCCTVTHHSAVLGLAYAFLCCSQLQAQIMTLYLAVHIAGSLTVYVDDTSTHYKYMFQVHVASNYYKGKHSCNFGCLRDGHLKRN